MRRLTVVLACLLPSALHASDPYTEFFTPTCQNNGLGLSCADVRMRVTDYASGSVMQMWFKVTSNPGGSYINDIWLFEKTPGAWGVWDEHSFGFRGGLRTDGRVGVTGSPVDVSDNFPAIRKAPDTANGYYHNWLGQPGIEEGVAGCITPTAINSYWQTCDAKGLDGWMLITLNGTDHFTVNDVDWQLYFGGGNTPQTTTPEPRTFVLLGTGLLGLAGVRRLVA